MNSIVTPEAIYQAFMDQGLETALLTFGPEVTIQNTDIKMFQHNVIVSIEDEEGWNVQDHLTNWDEGDSYLKHRHLWLTYIGAPTFSPSIDDRYVVELWFKLNEGFMSEKD